MKVILFLNSDLPPASIITSLHSRMKNEGWQVWCADGGVSSALKAGFRVDTVIGDLDSIRNQNIHLEEETRIIYRPSQYMNDLEKSLIFARESSVKELIISGVSGKRLDHTLANLSILLRYSSLFHLELYGPEGQFFLLTSQLPEVQFHAYPGQTISLIPLPYADGIVTGGLRYPLKNSSLHFGIREGGSNEAVADIVFIRIRSGTLLILANYPR